MTRAQQEKVTRLKAMFAFIVEGLAARGVSEHSRVDADALLDQALNALGQLETLVMLGPSDQQLAPGPAQQLAAILLLLEKTAWPVSETQPSFAGKPVERKGSEHIAHEALGLVARYVGTRRGEGSTLHLRFEEGQKGSIFFAKSP